jgi:hypothetical protein
MRRSLSRPSAGLVVAVVAVFLALGGTGLASVLINGSQIKNRSVGGIKIKKNSLTGTEIKESSLGTVPNAQNARNARNAQNAQNAQNSNTVGGKAAGAFAPAGKWALIAGTTTNATVLASSGGVTATRSGTGMYLVDVGGSVVDKPLSATFNFPFVGSVTVAPCGGSANNPGGTTCALFNDTNHVIVRTLNLGGAPTDSTFYLSIGG